jgi:hypothetical protein
MSAGHGPAYQCVVSVYMPEIVANKCTPVCLSDLRHVSHRLTMVCKYIALHYVGRTVVKATVALAKRFAHLPSCVVTRRAKIQLIRQLHATCGCTASPLDGDDYRYKTTVHQTQYSAMHCRQITSRKAAALSYKICKTLHKI